jgi:surfactin synthase thioesterase subunit
MSAPGEAAAWLRRYHVPDAPRARLVCFSHAGGSASAFRSLSAALHPQIETTAVQYPGRHDRGRDEPIEDIAGLACRIAEALQPWEGAHVAFLGHSMGALVAFETARRLVSMTGAAPAALFASGRRAPHEATEVPADLEDAATLVNELRRLSGTGTEVLTDDCLLEMVLRPLRSDLKAIRDYRYHPAPALACPIVAMLGDRDPTLRADDALRWSEHTTADCTVRVFDGDHFYLEPRLAEVAGLIRSVCLG